MMNLAKISKNGQITIPSEVRKTLNLEAGDKIIFIRDPNGEMKIKPFREKSSIEITPPVVEIS